MTCMLPLTCFGLNFMIEVVSVPRQNKVLLLISQSENRQIPCLESRNLIICLFANQVGTLSAMFFLASLKSVVVKFEK